MVAEDLDDSNTPTRTRRRWLYIALGVAVASIVSVTVVVALTGGEDANDAASVGDLSDPRTPVDHEFVIPLGTADRIDAGEDVEIIPARLEVRVGETMRIINLDYKGHNVGPYFIGREQTITQTFSQVGEIIGECSIHPSEQIVIEVLA